jgi:hypothetical protein
MFNPKGKNYSYPIYRGYVEKLNWFKAGVESAFLLLLNYEHRDTRSRHLQFNFIKFTIYSLTFISKCAIINIENKTDDKVLKT